MSRLVVTTSRSAGAELRSEAATWAQRLSTRCVPRRERSLARLAADEQVTGVLVVSARPPVYHEPAQGVTYFFHPSMARTRIHNLKVGRGDPLITATGLSAGDSVLDCTLGRACDAIVASWVVGERGKVVGVERVAVVAALTAYGLATYEIRPPDIAAALRRVEVHQADYHNFLRQCPAGSFDVVCFDPIFDQPLEASPAMAPLRAIGDVRPVDAAALEQARGVARRAVVIKQRRGSDYWHDLPWAVEVIAGGKSRIEYGLIAPDS